MQAETTKQVKLKIGVVFHGNPLAGGCFQQSLNATRLLSRNESPYEFLYYTPYAENALSFDEGGIEARTFNFGRKQRLVHTLRKQITLNRILDRFAFFQPFDTTFEKDDVDLLYFTGPSHLCLFLERLNYVLTVWDLCHRDHPEFPEVRSNREFEARENFLHAALPKAVAVIAESPIGKHNIECRFSLPADRVHWISVSPAHSTEGENEGINFDPRKALGIPDETQYVFYPAQFWAHKNHRLIVDALALLRKLDKRDLHAIFCGSDCGNLEVVLNMARKAGVEDLIHYTGFVPDEHMAAYYRNSLALVMPSYFGPTNMPPLEAFLLQTPAIVADLPGLREQVADAALTVAPELPEALRQAFIRLLDEPLLRQTLIEKGIRRLAEFTDEARLATLQRIFDSFARKRRTWTLEA